MTDNSAQIVTADGKGLDPRLAEIETDRGIKARVQVPVAVIMTEITTATTIVLTDTITAGAEIDVGEHRRWGRSIRGVNVVRWWVLGGRTVVGRVGHALA
jgi:hypothetical protein